jgi:hypothetical protein
VPANKNPGPRLVRLRATVVPYDRESAAIAIQLPATLYTTRFPNEVQIDVQTFWRDVTHNAEITLRLVGEDGAALGEAVPLRPQREGDEWRATAIEAVRFREPGSISLVIEHEGRERGNLRLEMKSGTGRPHRP